MYYRVTGLVYDTSTDLNSVLSIFDIVNYCNQCFVHLYVYPGVLKAIRDFYYTFMLVWFSNNTFDPLYSGTLPHFRLWLK